MQLQQIVQAHTYIMYGIRFKKNDILWTTPNTFVASSNCALHLGGHVDFVDIDYLSGNIDLIALEKNFFKQKKISYQKF